MKLMLGQLDVVLNFAMSLNEAFHARFFFRIRRTLQRVSTGVVVMALGANDKIIVWVVRPKVNTLDLGDGPKDKTSSFLGDGVRMME